MSSGSNLSRNSSLANGGGWSCSMRGSGVYTGGGGGEGEHARSGSGFFRRRPQGHLGAGTTGCSGGGGT